MPCTDAYEPNDTIGAAYGFLASGTVLSGKICLGTDEDWFEVNVTTPGPAHRGEASEQGQRPPDDLTFYDRIAEALRDVDRIVLLSHGTDSSNASNILTERLKKHDLGIYAKIISQAEVDTSAMTEAQVLAYGRQAVVTHTQRPP